MAEADGITVLDTGSEDQTAVLLRKRGVQVVQEAVTPWRFDAARNRALALVPEDADICVCTDLDEVFHPGWRQAAERAWKPGVNQLRYRYTWSFSESGEEGHVFYIEKIHSRHGFQWIGPVHEVLTCTVPRIATAEGIQLDHHPDSGKSRAQYLPLLELAVKEDPQNDRNSHYLGREYLYYGRWDDAIRELQRHLQLPTAQWKDERCASMRFLARCFLEKGDLQTAEAWLFRAVAEAPWLREPWLDLAHHLLQRKDWYGVCFAASRALKIRDRPENYISEAQAWGSLPYDMLSLGLYYTGSYQRAGEMLEEALRLSPEDVRLQRNYHLVQNRISGQNNHSSETA